ncbi:unnamed protein product [Prunus armeniaca]|uniref:Uncharacterized protein n=1 Tax=Prunus armeniaca TaxID=36596 RepID=A0A6J5W990_PRUAR|nr:unnamed protein product [Prunus armeniaca]
MCALHTLAFKVLSVLNFAIEFYRKGKKAIRYNVPVGFGEEARPWEISAPFTLPKGIEHFLT